ncbi:MAG: DNA replication/repair protein RecF [Coriobacteriia bacterium]
MTRIHLKDFRSYSEVTIVPAWNLTVIIGPNAAGKTNAIEAIELLTTGTSFRKPLGKELVRWGQERALLELVAEGEGRVHEARLEINKAGNRTFSINGKNRRSLSDIAGIVPCVVFTPDDLRIVKDSSDRRRAEVDSVGDQLSRSYRSTRQECERILKQRNLVLRENPDDALLLEAWTERLVEQGSAFSGHRRRLFDRMAHYIGPIYSDLSQGEVLEAVYINSWDRNEEAPAPAADDDVRERMREALKKKSAEERARGMTLVGPHRDEITFRIEGRDARSFGSQGQQRTIALAWKLAEVQVITDIVGQPPVLLLDDVMSELDAQRRDALTEFVGKSAQTLITTTNLGYFSEEILGRAKVVELG